MSWRRVVAWTGSVILAFGVLVLLFVAYDLWGTGISTRFHQEALRKQFNHELALARHQARATTTTTTAPGSPPTTQPIHGVVRATPGVPPADGQPIGTIDIPSIGVDYVVVQGTSTADLQLGPGHYDNTPLPGQPGNAAIAGHRTTYLHPFFNLNELVAGDPIYVTTTQGRFRYNVTTIMAVAPNDVAVVAPTPVPTLTLTTCNPRYSASQRLVVHGTLVSPPAPIPRATKAEIERAQDSGPDSVAAGLGGDRGSVWSTIWWGAGSVIFALAVWMLARRRHRLARISVVVVGSLVILVLLFFFFQSVSPLLPASF